MLAHVARALYIGVLNGCSLDPATALCLDGKAERSVPATAQCRPDRCPNSCITSRHRPVWAEVAAGAKMLLREKRLSEMQRTALRRDLDRIEVVIDRITTPASAGPLPRSSGI